MKNIFIFIYFLVTSFSGTITAQENNSLPSFRGKDTFPNYFKHILTSDINLISSQCVRFKSAIKFVIDEKGQIESIELPENLTGYLALKVRNALLTTHGQWNPESLDGIFVKSKPLILPLDFNYQGGCRTRKDSPEKIKADRALKFELESSSFYEEDAILFNTLNVHQNFGSEDIGDVIKKQ